MPFLTLADLIVIAAPVGIFLVRIANFINGELWGAVTDLPWGVVFASGGDLLRHPTQLYEAALEGVVILAILLVLAYRRPPLPRGSFLGLFLILYSVFRIAVEFVRQPDVQLGYLAGDWLTMGMLLSLPMAVAGVCVLLYAVKNKHPQQGPAILALSELTTAKSSEADAGSAPDAAGESDAAGSPDAPDAPGSPNASGSPDAPDAPGDPSASSSPPDSSAEQPKSQDPPKSETANPTESTTTSRV
jgi:phosphatidylglycerol:prolipoprotein diacylglycerol transferase